MIGYYEYDPVIYPRKLWVYIGDRLSEVCESFEDLVPDKDYIGLAYEETERKHDHVLGVLVAFNSKSSMTVGNIAHEAGHAMDFIESALGIDHNGENSAYLLGWIAECIEMAKNKKGKFINIERKYDK